MRRGQAQRQLQSEPPTSARFIAFESILCFLLRANFGAGVFPTEASLRCQMEHMLRLGRDWTPSQSVMDDLCKLFVVDKML